MNPELKFQEAKSVLNDKPTTEEWNKPLNKWRDLPHLKIDINIDGAQVFNNSDQSIIPILGKIHSIEIDEKNS